MTRFRPILARLVLTISLAALAVAPGCGGPPTVANSPENFDTGALEEVAELYRYASNRNKKPPTSLKDLVKGRELFMAGYNAIDRGEIIVYWGVTVTSGDDSGGSDEILAYKADVPSKGGPVLLKNSTVKSMTVDQFNAAPKPASPTSARGAVG